jgi:hypothetical protein
MEETKQKIERYLRQLAPHQNEREGPMLLREALDVINRLNAELNVVHNARRRNDHDTDA